jgi:hypothetical protein
MVQIYRFSIYSEGEYIVMPFKILGKLHFTPMNYNALALSPHELPTVLLCPHKLLFCAQKPILSVKAVNLNSQPITLHHFAPMNYNALSLCPYELQRIVILLP